jgi:hypothetical protein
MDSEVTSTAGFGVVFYVDGYCDHAVEFIRNVTVQLIGGIANTREKKTTT